VALQEFALGIEDLERFVRREPLRRIHKCVFGVLALESERADPRLSHPGSMLVRRETACERTRARRPQIDARN
jgi:hypothetical protein